MYGHGYPYRLAASFELPYRAYRIAQLLHERTSYDVEFFRRMQLDDYSPVDAEIARAIRPLQSCGSPLGSHAQRAALTAWGGRFSPESSAATLAYDLRTALGEEEASLPVLLDRLRSRSACDEAWNAGAELAMEPRSPQSWSARGRIDVLHPLSALWYGMMSGRQLPGDGNDYTVRLQTPGFAQGFRAVWDVGNWDRGGIALPSGESGQPGSPFYDDRASDWIAGKILPLPFSRNAVDRSTVQTLTLLP